MKRKVDHDLTCLSKAIDEADKQRRKGELDFVQEFHKQVKKGDVAYQNVWKIAQEISFTLFKEVEFGNQLGHGKYQIILEAFSYWRKYKRVRDILSNK